MRTARITGHGGAGYYHCMSRVIERKMIMGREEKEKFRRLMRAVEGFCSVKVITWTALSNHWHILLYVPRREEVSDMELIGKLRLVYGKEYVKDVESRLKEYREAGEERLAEKLKGKYTYRMYDLSEFMKMFKQRYTQWYNRRNGRKGTLWEERYKSVLIEGTEHALSTVAAYIDLNAVRAGVVKDPKEYRYSGYGEAVAGVREAREGLMLVMQSLGGVAEWREVSRGYRQYLYVKGEERIGRAGFSREEVEETLRRGGRLELKDLLMCRVRYLSDGVVLGSKAFVDGVFKANRGMFSGRRKSGARPMRLGEWGGLCTARDLRMRVISVSGSG